MWNFIKLSIFFSVKKSFEIKYSLLIDYFGLFYISKKTYNVNKICQRCKKDFDCNCISIESCECSSLVLSPVTKEYLSKTSYNCLCTNCLTEVENFASLAKRFPFPKSPTEYVEGIHYYIEGQYWVFTTFYHYLKGSCCKNNCRHCAYGYRP